MSHFSYLISKRSVMMDLTYSKSKLNRNIKNSFYSIVARLKQQQKRFGNYPFLILQKKWSEERIVFTTSNQIPALGAQCPHFPSHLRLFKDQVTLLGGFQRRPRCCLQ